MFKRRRPEDEAPPSGAARMSAPGSAPQREFRGSPGASDSEPVDNGLGVPPFRPAPAKEAPAMGRSPFASTPAPVGGPATRPLNPPTRVPGREPAERRTLVVGHGISVQGTVQDAERLVVEGTVEASMIHATELSIAPGGVFKGEVEVEDAEIAGTIDGTLTARGSLIVRASGKVLGTARCRRLQVEDGGQITGRMEMLTEATGDGRAGGPREVPRVEPVRPAASESAA
ncbi:MAG TPA: polymer-forming cytoskeletal protein [Acetobacteraceae bacterium]|nr:polymer-forming cytoskeletal protein [Acetobacteraceae bacterium]